MKRLFLFLFTCLSLSCSTEDSETERQNSEDPIIGKWSHTKLVEYPSNGPSITTEEDHCYQLSWANFKAYGNIEQYLLESDSNGECQEYVDPDLISNKWERVGDGIYRFIQSHRNINGEVDEYTTTPDKISFPNANTMEILRYGTNRPYNDPIDVEYYVNHYKRVN